MPLNCVDKCLLALDGANEPMIVHAIVDVSGPIDEARLDRAIRSAQQAHPVMRTILRTKYFRPVREIQEVSGKSVLTVWDTAKLEATGYQGCLAEWINQPMDLGKGFPVRVLLLKNKEVESTLVFTYHHVAADGVRAIHFTGKVIASYNGASLDPEPQEEIRMSHKRDEMFEFAQSQRSRVKRYYLKVFADLANRFVLSALPPPTRVFHDLSGSSRELDVCSETLGPAELESIEARARSASAGLNDLLLAACARVVEEWNRVHGRSSNRIRIMTPINVRPKGFRNIVSNQVCWVSPVTTPTDRADPPELLRRLRAYTTGQVRSRRAFSLIYFYYLSSRLPPVAMRAVCRFLVISRTYIDTIIITNIGQIWPKTGSDEPELTRMGDSRILNVTGSAPVVSPMGLSICPSIYNRNLTLCLTYRSAFFSREKARQLLDMYVDEVRNYDVGPAASHDSIAG